MSVRCYEKQKEGKRRRRLVGRERRRAIQRSKRRRTIGRRGKMRTEGGRRNCDIFGHAFSLVQ